jgi:histone acetyltransferase (RNA polymerase elongator complex component)
MTINMNQENVRALNFEQGPIRPPSEAHSLLLRVTRNCPWNKCTFCRTYKGQRFSLRSVEEVKADIDSMAEIARRIKQVSWQMGLAGQINADVVRAVCQGPNADDGCLQSILIWLYHGARTAFLQDANSLVMKTQDLLEILQHLLKTFPGIQRITSYARSHTMARKSVEELKALREAGLNRIHIGLESGCDAVLHMVHKGVTAEEHIEAGLRVKAAGMELSEYVILGLGGRSLWRQHALDTARVLTRIDPHFIRVRTLAVPPAAELSRQVASGQFQMMTDDEIVEEERLLIENLGDVHSRFVSDHILNLLEEVEGTLPQDRDRMLAVIDRYRGLSGEERRHFQIGRRTGRYRYLSDMSDLALRLEVEDIRRRLEQCGSGWLENDLKVIMAGYI